MECKDRNNRRAIMLPYSFLPTMASQRLRDAADKVLINLQLISCAQVIALLGDYDSIHVRRGIHGQSLYTTRLKNGFHLDELFLLLQMRKTPGFFSPLAVRYKLAYSSNYSGILDPVIENNYQLFMIERLILMGAKTFIKTFKEDDTDLSLTDDPKKNTKSWQLPVYTMDEVE
ncbi:hypothetical protein OIU76_021450 [Salix suchowensis]|nr:hypothetical protein OIU76_021450 [Salix suchowensis]